MPRPSSLKGTYGIHGFAAQVGGIDLRNGPGGVRVEYLFRGPPDQILGRTSEEAAHGRIGVRVPALEVLAEYAAKTRADNLD